MQKQEVPGEHLSEEPDEPQWTSSVKPRLGWREQLILTFDRFGFWFACGVTFLILATLFYRYAQVPDPTPGLHGAGGMQAPSVPPGQPGLLTGQSGAAAAPLAITTDPAGASIYVDGEYVGVTPLRGVMLAQGPHIVSVHKPDYATLDTVITLAETSAVLLFSLRSGEAFVLAATESAPPPREPPASEAAEDLGHPDAPAPEVGSPTPPETAPSGPQQPPPEADASRATAQPAVDDTPSTDEATVTDVATVADSDVEEPAPAMGALEVVSEPAGATVWLGEQQAGLTPLVLTDVAAGTRQVTLRLEGYQAYTTTVRVEAGQRRRVDGKLQYAVGTLKVLVKPWGTIYIDGRLHQREADVWYTTTLTPGLHRLRVDHPSLGRWEQAIDIVPGEVNPITIDFNRQQ